MPDTSTHLLLPYLLAAQAQKHITVNEALRLLDGLVQLAVLNRHVTAPPASPADGARYIVAPGATGAWAGWDLNVAYYVDGAWTRLVPRTGWQAWVVDEANRTYKQLRIDGRASQRDIAALDRYRDPRINPHFGILAAYAANELTPSGRESLLAWLLASRDRGARILVVEPIARRALPWWSDWKEVFAKRGGRADEWRFPAELPPTQRALARAAGLDPRELTARSLFL